MAILLPEGKQSFADSAGAPLNGGLLYTWAPGTSTPKATYSDAAGSVPNTNPIVLNARGEATVFWSGGYKVELRTSAGGVIWTVDNVNIDPSAASLDATLRADLASAVDPAKGANMVGYGPDVAYTAGTGKKLRELVSVDDAGATGNGITNDAVDLQEALTALLTRGGTLSLTRGKTYKCNSALTLRRSSAGHAKSMVIDGQGCYIDFSGMGTSGSALTVGATSSTYFLEDGGIVLRNITLIGPENTALDPRTDAPGGSTVGLDLQFCGGVTLENVRCFYFYNNCHSLFSFPLKAINCNFRRAWIGLHLDEASNDQDWDGLTLPNCRYPILIKSVSTSLDAGKINNVIFRRPWVEGSSVGPVIDSGVGGAGAVRFRSIRFEDPYLALITYDHFRMGTEWTLATPATRGANCTEFINDVWITGGLMNPAGGLYSATQALVAMDSATRVRHLFIDTPTIDYDDDTDVFVGAPGGGVYQSRAYPGVSDARVDQVRWNNVGSVAYRLKSDGNLLIGTAKTATATVSSIGHELKENGVQYVTADGASAQHVNRLTSDGTLATFYRSSVAVGSISVTTTATAYNTSSDYRLKRDVQAADKAAAFAAVMAWPIRSFSWRSTGQHGIGVLAHELQALKPDAVSGSKDAGAMQGVDYSKLIPELVAAVQHIGERVAAIESALEGKP